LRIPTAPYSAKEMEYPSLDSSQKQTRLLHLHPGKPEDEVACHFSILSFKDHQTDYEALSYVWGSARDERIATVDGTPMSITDNLWQALVALRYLDKDRILWVDALCINQSDDKERSHQVSQMKHIYSQASSVEIWLGESNEYFETAFRFVAEIATRLTAEGDVPSYGYVVNAFHKDYDPKTTNEGSLDDNTRKAVALVTAITMLAKMPWFERTWTVQEFALAKKATFHGGSHTLDNGIFMQFMYHLLQHNESCCAINLPVVLLKEIITLFFSTHAIMALKRFRITLLLCVGGFRFRKATDPRDKIYGLLGLDTDDTTEHVRMDYTQSVEEVYEDFLYSHLIHTKKLDILSHLRTDRRSNLKLPSFVPDWSLNLSDLSIAEMMQWSVRCGILEIYNAAAGAQLEFKTRPGILAIKGVIIDAIKMIATNSIHEKHQATPPHSASNDYLDEYLAMAAVPPREKDDGLIRRQAFWLAMVAECKPLVRETRNPLEVQPTIKLSESYGRLNNIPVEVFEGYEAYLRTLGDASIRNSKIPDVLYPIDVAADIAQIGRRFMVTQGGRMGLVPPHAQEGDVVAVLTGGHVPIILRPRDGYHTVVGDAYVQGIMDGEAMPVPEELEYIVLR
jgi:hypothetical protein